MTAAVTTPGSYLGADVDGLDKLGAEFTQAAEVCNVVKAACEVIVAAASLFGPFGAAFVAYLKGTVIPWLTKIAEALTLMAKVLSVHSQAQKDASSSATSPASLPSYTTPANLPTGSTGSYPTLGAAPAGATTAPSPATPGVSTVATPPALGGTPTTTPTTTPTVQAITALTGLVTAVDHLIHPASGATTTPVTASPVTATPVTAAPVTGADPSGGAALGSVPSITDVGAGPGTRSVTVGGLTGTLGGGIDVGGLTPLHPGDTVGVVSVPVDIAPDGTITPLTHGAAAPITAAPITAAPISATPAHVAPAVTTSHLPSGDVTGGASGGVGGGSGGASTGGLGGVPAATVHPSAATAAPAAPHAVTTAHHAAEQPGPLAASTPGPSHDGLYAGLGQATGIGAGGAALARATLHEARQRAEAALTGGALPLPSDAAADAAVRATVLGSELR